MRNILFTLALIVIGCDQTQPGRTSKFGTSSSDQQASGQQTLVEARSSFTTTIVSAGDDFGPPDTPPGRDFNLIHYESPVGPLAAYVTTDPGTGKRRPAIIWITGGDNNSIGDVWSSNPPDNDQSAAAFRRAGVAMMFPSQRGGNDNPGQREGFYGEVDDVLAAADYLAGLPYIDPAQIYLGGHSTGGTLVMLIAECSDRFKAAFSLGPVASPIQYGGDFVYHDTTNNREAELRSPVLWLDSVKSPLYVFEGANRGNWDAIEMMVHRNTNPQIQFFKVNGHDHFSVIAPLAQLLARQIINGQVNVTQQDINGL